MRNFEDTITITNTENYHTNITILEEIKIMRVTKSTSRIPLQAISIYRKKSNSRPENVALVSDIYNNFC